MIARKGARVVLVREPLGWFGAPARGAVGTVERAFWGGLDGRVLVRLDGRHLVACERKDLESATEDLDGIVLAIAREVAPRCRTALHALELLDELERGDERVTRQLGIRWPREVAAGGARG